MTHGDYNGPLLYLLAIPAFLILFLSPVLGG